MFNSGQTIHHRRAINKISDNRCAYQQPLDDRGEHKNSSALYPKLLLVTFFGWWSLLAINPWFRQDWLLENALVFIAVPVLIWGYRRLPLSNLSYGFIFIFLCLHEIGAHYTYSEVPYRAWFLRHAGLDINALLGIERNHFDRAVHFSYGLLMLLPCVEIFKQRASLVGMWQRIIPVTFLMSNSEIFELIEWQAAVIFGGPLGQAYLGTQGDIWDAQKDSLAAVIGAMIAMTIYQLHRRLIRTSIKN
jgi:putative membrane protein